MSSASTCDHCQKPETANGKLLKCSKCLNANYCSPECQKAAWKSHKQLCSSKSATTSDPSPSITPQPTTTEDKDDEGPLTEEEKRRRKNKKKKERKARAREASATGGQSTVDESKEDESEAPQTDAETVKDNNPEQPTANDVSTPSAPQENDVPAQVPSVPPSQPPVIAQPEPAAVSKDISPQLVKEKVTTSVPKEAKATAVVEQPAVAAKEDTPATIQEPTALTSESVPAPDSEVVTPTPEPTKVDEPQATKVEEPVVPQQVTEEANTVSQPEVVAPKEEEQKEETKAPEPKPIDSTSTATSTALPVAEETPSAPAAQPETVEPSKDVLPVAGEESSQEPTTAKQVEVEEPVAVQVLSPTPERAPSPVAEPSSTTAASGIRATGVSLEAPSSKEHHELDRADTVQDDATTQQGDNENGGYVEDTMRKGLLRGDANGTSSERDNSQTREGQQEDDKAAGCCSCVIS